MIEPLIPNELFKCCEIAALEFETTVELKEFMGTIGQEKALHALDFGLSLDSAGFNIFAMGEDGTGKMRTIRTLLSERASQEKIPPDWCYVHNFKNPDYPLAISLDPGKGGIFQNDMNELVKILRDEIPKSFDSKEYGKQRGRIIEEFQQKQKELFAGLEEESQSKGFAIRKTVSGLMIVPIKKNNEPLTEEEFAALDEKTKKRVEEVGKALQEKLDDVVRAVREAEKLVKEMLARLERDIALGSVGHLIEGPQEKIFRSRKNLGLPQHGAGGYSCQSRRFQTC